jgi:hypothetical protein
MQGGVAAVGFCAGKQATSSNGTTAGRRQIMSQLHSSFDGRSKSRIPASCNVYTIATHTVAVNDEVNSVTDPLIPDLTISQNDFDCVSRVLTNQQLKAKAV